MNETTNYPVSISIDMKKSRIRLHKTTLHLLGDPPYIFLLVNPERKSVAIKSAERYSSSGLAHKVSRQILKSDNSVEIYSHFFIDKLKEVSSVLDSGSLFRMTGELIPQEKMAVFSLKTLTKIS